MPHPEFETLLDLQPATAPESNLLLADPDFVDFPLRPEWFFRHTPHLG